ncbi:MadR family response regulator transcription factor [Rudaeicoccus suwonensis]|uniref:LuxR family two component transcriptional regulator n=1 Tax=Rudaeicoccus suwonensis TaxID=657409 RepID=A0A561E8K1_9MICO|nr:response regulator transcription factor [Rudaeicoccus suwonensis]TWE11939.1 LuxR family two component transcriptional regulator [Rudaeicoccus suwonensis]
MIDLAPDARQDTVTVVLVDDHAVVRQGLRVILERESDLRVVGEATTAEEALAVVRHTDPSVVVLDLKLSAQNDAEGLSVCAELTRAHPQLGVLVFSTFADDHLVLDAVRAGARGYVVKDVDTSALIHAIRDVHNGDSAFDSRSAAAMVRGLKTRDDPEDGHLTEREREVLSLLAHGNSNKDIGKQLFISEATAKFHVGNILRKLGVSRRAEAVYAASKLGVI